MQNSKKCPPNLITFFEDMLNLVFQMGKSEMERKGNFAPSYLSFPVPFRPFQINPAFLSLSEKNGQLSGKGNIAFLSLTCMNLGTISTKLCVCASLGCQEQQIQDTPSVTSFDTFYSRRPIIHSDAHTKEKRDLLSQQQFLFCFQICTLTCQTI